MPIYHDAHTPAIKAVAEHTVDPGRGRPQRLPHADIT